MKKFFIYIIIFSAILSCSDSASEKKKFLKAYKDIIVARNIYQDTARANEEVSKIYKTNGFTEETFRKKYFEYAQNSKEFLAMLDSARQWAQNEIIILESRLKKDSIKYIGASPDTTIKRVNKKE
jgi:hypothetical protein